MSALGVFLPQSFGRRTLKRSYYLEPFVYILNCILVYQMINLLLLIC
jgi:hypothetical protein